MVLSIFGVLFGKNTLKFNNPHAKNAQNCTPNQYSDNCPLFLLFLSAAAGQSCLVIN